ncbi:hypothetical protein [Methylobacterium thuringiense]|uniref:Uncharacterized protein n=1 Tax=Methylobacterium thuringiense TaxID=1003091 RepID=A0ABQ4TNR7_9HYPH|nr:hypothetical protein [Methylobacterium thuringiense]GJE56941.1 hypothetical protein EKPJFOCH_3451 [Methylobacterium thuringiense]
MSEIPQGGLPGGADTPPSYRVLLFDRDGKVQSSVPIPVHDDELAKAVAQRMSNGLSAELWDGLRYIEQFDGTD